MLDPSASYTFLDHELLIRKIANEVGFAHISLSSQLQAVVRLVPRGVSATADAYLTPHIRIYLDSIAQGSYILTHSDDLRYADWQFIVDPQASRASSKMIRPGSSSCSPMVVWCTTVTSRVSGLSYLALPEALLDLRGRPTPPKTVSDPLTPHRILLIFSIRSYWSYRFYSGVRIFEF